MTAILNIAGIREPVPLVVELEQLRQIIGKNIASSQQCRNEHKKCVGV